MPSILAFELYGLHRDSLVGLLLALADRHWLLPNVAVAELIDYQPPVPLAHQPSWQLGQITWRDQRLPLLSLEAVRGAPVVVPRRARIVILNALNNSGPAFMALLLQDIPRSCRIDAQLSYVDIPLDPLELAAVQVGEIIARVPDLEGLGALADSDSPERQ